MKISRRNMLAWITAAFGFFATAIGSLFGSKDKTRKEAMTAFKATDDQAINHRFTIDFHWPTQDPFLFCAYHKDHYPEGKDDLAPKADLSGRNIGMDFQIKDGFRMYHGDSVPGFPVHPHRGFETVTIVREGFVDHADSLGAAGRYGAGDVQWMTAGAGIQHSEMFPLVAGDRPNPLELFQVWLNLPKASKFAKPHFTMFWNEKIPFVEQDNAKIEIIAGDYAGKKALDAPPESWASNSQGEVAIWLITLKEKGRLILPKASQGLNRTLYFHQGDEVILGGKKERSGQGFQLDSTKSLSLENQEREASMLFLQGRPIGDPVVQHGPFVMNTKQEIVDAINDYRATQFGGWPWKRQDMVHSKSQGRFALHPDGKREEPA